MAITFTGLNAPAWDEAQALAASKVLTIVPEPKPSPDLVKLLESMLEHAKSGRMTFACVVGTLADGSVIDGWSNATDVRPYTVLGALEAVKMEFSRRNIE